MRRGPTPIIKEFDPEGATIGVVAIAGRSAACGQPTVSLRHTCSPHGASQR